MNESAADGVLFHVSEQDGIARFEPRPSDGLDRPVVWAVDATRLHNYLLPRDCPRVTYYAGENTADSDVRRFLGPSKAVVVIERGWWERLRACRLYCYHLPSGTFTCVDDCAGYFVSSVAVVPEHVELIDDASDELVHLLDRARLMENLWPIRDAVAASSLRFSMIRIRNARPRDSRAGLPTG